MARWRSNDIEFIFCSIILYISFGEDSGESLGIYGLF